MFRARVKLSPIVRNVSARRSDSEVGFVGNLTGIFDSVLAVDRGPGRERNSRGAGASSATCCAGYS